MLWTPGSRSASLTRMSVNDSSETRLARSDMRCGISRASKPGVSVGTAKPRTVPSSARAQTIATSAMVPFEIQVFEPLITQSPPTLRALVRIPAGLLPASASVRPKQPQMSPAAMPGSQRCFCSSLPYCQIGNIESEPCTESDERRAASPYSISSATMP